MKFRELLEELDAEFLAGAEKCTSFNLPKGSFQSLTNKAEIRHLIQKNWFSGKDINFYQTFNESDLKNGIKQLKGLGDFGKLFGYKPDGTGPGEIMIYFLFDDVTIGGGSSAGLDISTPNAGYELKAVNPIKTAGVWGSGLFVNNFKLGGTVRLDSLVTRLRDLKAKLTDKKLLSAKEVGHSHYKEFEKLFPKEWKEIVNEYQDQAYSYFKEHDVILLDAKKGDLIFMGSFNKDSILMDNQTSGTIKPVIRLK